MSAIRDDPVADPWLIVAELRRERDEALARETAMAEVLQVINSSPGDLATVFNAILEKATRICEAVFGVLLTGDGERLHRVAFRGVPTELVEALREPMTPVPGTIADRLVRGERVIATADLREAEYTLSGPGAQAFLRHGARSVVHVALHKEERLLGSITVYREEVRPFTTTQIALLQNFAAQAVIAIENARLLTETREAREQQTATAEVLQVISSSPGDLATVFDAMLEKALRLCEAAHGHIWRIEGEYAHAVALRGDAHFIEAMRRNGPAELVSGRPLGRIARGEHLVHMPDATKEEVYRTTPGFREFIDASGIRTGLMVALRKDEALLGAIVVHRKAVLPFTDKQIVLLEKFAAQAVIAMENARLLTETREALEQQTATAEVLKAISRSTFDLRAVLQTVVSAAHRLCQSDYSVIFRKEGDEYRWAAGYGISAEYEERERRAVIRPGTETVIGRAVLAGHAVQIADAKADPLYQGEAESDARAMLGVPLLRDGVAIGGIGLARNCVEPFTDKQVQLVTTFADQAVIAIDNARLLTQTREALEQQTATAEVLQVINSSPGDLAPVFDAMLEKAMRLCGAAFGALFTYDGTRFPFVSSRGFPTTLLEYYREPIGPPPPGSAMERLVCGESTSQVTDIRADTFRSPIRRALADLGGARTMIWVALRKEEALLGCIAIYRQEVRPFADKEIALLENFAAQAVIAMENARLLGELRERTEEVAGW